MTKEQREKRRADLAQRNREKFRLYATGEFETTLMPDLGKLIVLPGGATYKKEQSEEDMVKEQLANFKSRVGAPANYNYQSATCPPDPDTLGITELNTKKCTIAPNSFLTQTHPYR